MLSLSFNSACSVSFARLIYVSVRFDDPDTLYNAALTSEMTLVTFFRKRSLNL